MRRANTALFACCAVALAGAVAAADEDLGPFPRSKAAAEVYNNRAWAISATIPDMVHSPDVATYQEAVAKTRTLLRARLKYVTGAKGDAIMKAFADREKYDDLLGLIDYGLSQHPESTDEVSVLQYRKVHLLIKTGKADAALAAAKIYYNLAPMASTSEAIQLFAVTILAAKPQEAGLADRFREEQVLGAQFPADGKVASPRPRTSVLASIPIDPSPFQEALKARSDLRYDALRAKGNLLLMSDLNQEAYAAFYAAHQLANDKQLAESIEDIARAIRAVDGSIGRANAWIDSLRVAN